jgi:5-(carboxyamino)imidazole ribonucleotide synthase
MAPPIVAVVGGGQLARMLAEAASPLGIHLRVLAATGDEGAREVVPDVVEGDPDDPAAIAALADGVDVVTFDHENVDLEALESLEAAGVPVRPSVSTLRCSDKAHQRRTFAAAGLPVPPFAVLDGGADDVAAARAFATTHAPDGERVVVKASRGGYDGRGVWMLGGDELEEFVAGWTGAPLVLEPELPLIGEFAVLVARRPSGGLATWPVLRTIQVDGMCDEVALPSELAPELEQAAIDLAGRVAEVSGAVGVLAVELFLVGGDAAQPALLVNEIAPRVHNSGHLTSDACATSQFEQHLRAVLDWPLGPTNAVVAAATMVNVVGGADDDPRDRQAVALESVPEAHVHLYGKTPRAGRKIGHVTVTGDDVEVTGRRARLAADLLAGGD